MRKWIVLLNLYTWCFCALGWTWMTAINRNELSGLTAFMCYLAAYAWYKVAEAIVEEENGNSE